jgi:hypothetical protein
MSPSRSDRMGRRKAKERRRQQRLARQQAREEKRELSGQEVLEKQRARRHQATIDPAVDTHMAAVMQEFVQPYLVAADTDELLEKLYGLASVAWNASFVDEQAQTAEMDKIIGDIAPGAPRRKRENMRALIAHMIARRKQLFSEHQRLIVNYKLHPIGQELHLTVASMPVGPQNE